MRAKLLVLSCLAAAGAAQAADMRAVPPASVAGGAPRTVQDVTVSTAPAQDANAVNPFPCLFGCFGYQPAQTASAPAEATEPVEIRPRKQAKSKWTQHAFAQARSAKHEGRSVATARKISRPAAAPQAVRYRPNYDMPLDADAVPMEWQLRAEPPVAGATPQMQVGPFGGLK